MKNKTSVQLYYDYKEQFDLLNDSQLRKVVYAMLTYDEHNKLAKLDKVSTMAFSFIKKRMDYDKAKYADKCLHNKEKIEKYWENKKIPMNTNVYHSIPMNKKNTDIELDIELELDKELDIKNNSIIKERENVAVATSPTLENILLYASPLGVDEKYCENFYNYYESIGWKTKNGTDIKNWKAKLTKWIDEDKERFTKTSKEKIEIPDYNWLEEEEETMSEAEQESMKERLRKYKWLTKNI